MATNWHSCLLQNSDSKLSFSKKKPSDDVLRNMLMWLQSRLTCIFVAGIWVVRTLDKPRYITSVSIWFFTVVVFLIKMCFYSFFFTSVTTSSRLYTDTMLARTDIMPMPTNNVYGSERKTATDSSHCLVQCAAVTLEACVLRPGIIMPTWLRRTQW